MKKKLLICAVLILVANFVFASDVVRFTVINSGYSDTRPISVGLDISATDSLDIELGEEELPNFGPPGGNWGAYIHIDDMSILEGYAWSRVDLRPYQNTDVFSISYHLKTFFDNGDTLSYEWTNLPQCVDSIILSDMIPETDDSINITELGYMAISNQYIEDWALVVYYNFTNDIKEVTNKVCVYPNPSSDYIRIENMPHIAKYEIFDILGRKLLSGENQNDDIYITDLEDGVYYIMINDKKSYKFIKQ